MGLHCRRGRRSWPQLRRRGVNSTLERNAMAGPRLPQENLRNSLGGNAGFNVTQLF
jgi:hypothetical protein